MKSRIYEGQVRHRRFAPKPHCFDYRLYMMYLDLEELPDLFQQHWFWSVDRKNIASFRRRDHLGDDRTPLVEAVREMLFEQTGLRSNGPIRLLTHMRYFGFGFNPVSFYYCYDEQDTAVEHIIAEVNNTPWREQYCYVLTSEMDVSDAGHHMHRYTPVKDFHVSPFMPMNIKYDWRFGEPGERLNVHMQNYIEDQKMFDATLDLYARDISSYNLARALVRFPLVTVKVVAGIYFEALRLLIKRTPVYDHPATTINKIESRES